MRTSDWRLIIALAAGMACIMVANTITSGWLNNFGIIPRTTNGLIGVLFSPFLHAGWAHLLSNLSAFIPLALMSSMTGKGHFIKSSLIIIILGGLLTWLMGRGASHVGASGWVFGLWAFVIANGVFRRDLKGIGLAVLVAIVFATMPLGLIPRHGVSFEGHLFGLVAGMIAAKALIFKQIAN
jgi:membrane associated rhomboid family serine protease